VLGELPTRSAIIDGEIMASDAAGIPDFWPLFLRSSRRAELRVWAFDLLALDGKDLRKWSRAAVNARGLRFELVDPRTEWDRDAVLPLLGTVLRKARKKPQRRCRQP
jgi:hypothetical protein